MREKETERKIKKKREKEKETTKKADERCEKERRRITRSLHGPRKVKVRREAKSREVKRRGRRARREEFRGRGEGETSRRRDEILLLLPLIPGEKGLPGRS